MVKNVKMKPPHLSPPNNKKKCRRGAKFETDNTSEWEHSNQEPKGP